MRPYPRSRASCRPFAADAEVRASTPISVALLQAPCLSCRCMGQPAHRGQDQRPGQLGPRHRRAHAFGPDAQPRRRCNVAVAADRAGLRDQLQLGSFLEQARGSACARGSRPALRRRAGGSTLADAFDGVGEDLAREGSTATRTAAAHRPVVVEMIMFMGWRRFCLGRPGALASAAATTSETR